MSALVIASGGENLNRGQEGLWGSMNEIMDELDKTLLSYLQSQGFEKSSALALRLGVGERTIRRRLSALKSKGFIKIIAVPNPVLYGYRAWAKIGIDVELRFLREVAHELIHHPSIYFVAYSLGRFDIMIAVHFNTIERLTYFVGSELTRFKGIKNTETMILTSPRKYYNFTWPEPYFDNSVGGQYFVSAADDSRENEIDDIDRRIMIVLSEDGLSRPSTLKKRLGIGEGTIRKRIKKMLQNGIYKMEVVPNPETLEYQVWATMGIKINNQTAHNVINAIIEYPSVYLASASTGRFDIVISARFQNIDQLPEFVSKELAKIEGISNVETFLHTKPLKYHNIKWFDPMNQW